MTVAVSCNLSDGVILGVDSAVTVPAPGGVLKVYENAEKLFQLGENAIGIATFGLGSFGKRSVGSYIREFEMNDPKSVVTSECSVEEIVEELRHFFFQVYMDTVVPELEVGTGKKFDKIPLEERPGFGLVVGGFSAKAYLSEVWAIGIPQHSEPNSAVCQRKQGEFGTNWFAAFGPIRRYIKGFEPELVNELLDYTKKILGRDFSSDEGKAIQQILQKYEYPIPFHAMPMEVGIEHTRFLVELAISHHRYAVGAPIVGGKTVIGKVTYKGEHFQILQN